MDWILDNIGPIVIVLFVTIVLLFPWIKRWWQSGGGAAKRRLVEAAIVRHLRGKHWALGSGAVPLWAFDADDVEDDDELDPADDAAMAELYQEKGFFGYQGSHFCKVATDKFAIDESILVVEMQLFWDKHETDPKVKIFLDHGKAHPSEKGLRPFDSGNAHFDRFFKTRQANSHVAQRLAASGDRLDDVGQFVEKWGHDLKSLAIKDSLEVKVHERLFVTASQPADRFESFLDDVSKLAGTIETAIDPSFVAEEPPSQDGPRYVAVKVITTCGDCHSGVPVNGPLLDFTCPSCQAEMSVLEGYWDLLEAPEKDYVQGKGGYNRNMATDFRWEVSLPKCVHCGKELPVDRISVGSDRQVVCPACGKENSTFPAPEWLKKQIPRVEQIYCAEREQGKQAGKPVKLDEAASAPIAMTCPQCGGALSITDETERITKCPYCQVEVHLPDPVWKRLHPVKTAQVWYVRYAAK